MMTDLNAITTAGTKAYVDWYNSVLQVMTYLQTLITQYIQLHGSLPAELDPAKDISALFEANKVNVAGATALVEKAKVLEALLSSGTDPVHHGGDVFVPAGANPFEYLLLEAKKKYTSPKFGDIIPIYLPAGASKGVSMGGSGWTSIPRVDPWWGDATIVLLGHPKGTEVLPAHNEDNWGTSFEIAPETDSGQPWGGYVQVFDIKFYATGGNVISLGRFGTQEKKPLKGLVFKRCQFLDHPDPKVTCIRPISANQCSMVFLQCLWNLPSSEEHAVYSRNPYGNSVMQKCVIKGVGAQIWQEVGRPDEGPFFGYPGGTTSIVGNWACCYHKNPGRAGSAITIAGSARDWLVKNNIIQDLDESDDVYGGFVAWDGGKHYALSGEDMTDKPEDYKKGKYANGRVIVTDNIFVQKNGNRDIFQINSCLYAEVKRNGFYGSKPCDISSDPDAGIGELFWEDNNREEEKQKAIAAGIPVELLNNPQLKMNKDFIGVVAGKYHVVNDQLV